MVTGEPCKFTIHLSLETNLPNSAEEFPEFTEELKAVFEIDIEAKILESLKILSDKWQSGDYTKDEHGMNHITWSETKPAHE